MDVVGASESPPVESRYQRRNGRQPANPEATGDLIGTVLRSQADKQTQRQRSGKQNPGTVQASGQTNVGWGIAAQYLSH